MAFGMLPLAMGYGSGAEFYSPLAIAIIGGMTSSTFGSLLIIPTFYAMGDDLSIFTKRAFSAIVGFIEKLPAKIMRRETPD